MKTITLEEFKALIARKDWASTQDFTNTSTGVNIKTRFNQETGEYENYEVESISGIVNKTSTLDNLSVSYNEFFRITNRDLSTLEITPYIENNKNGKWVFDVVHDIEDIWLFYGVEIVDDERKPLCSYALYEYLTEEFGAIDYTKLNMNEISSVDY